MSGNESNQKEYCEWLNALFRPLIEGIPLLEGTFDTVVDKENCIPLGDVLLIEELKFIEDFSERCCGAIFGDAPPEYEQKEIEFHPREIANNPELIEQACLEDLCTYVGNMERYQRVHSGLIASMVKKGEFLAIARRAKSLLE